MPQICQHYGDGVAYFEDLLWKQLVAAIGKEVTPAHFAEYMQFHYRKIFRQAYEPRAFCYAVRRPAHYPEGTLSLEAEAEGGAMPEPIRTLVHSSDAAGRPMYFALDAATKVEFVGEHFVHAYVHHKFSQAPGARLQLAARARQFSSFIGAVPRCVPLLCARGRQGMCRGGEPAVQAKRKRTRQGCIEELFFFC